MIEPAGHRPDPPDDRLQDDGGDTTSHGMARRLSRRRMLKSAGIGAAAVLLGSAAATGVRAQTNGVWVREHGDAYALWRDWQAAPGLEKLVAAGSLAANPHNIQPWSFAIGANSIEVYSDPARAMPVSDSSGRERIAGCGCAIENLVVAARSEDLDAAVTAWPDTDPEHIAHIDLAPGGPATAREQELASAIAGRHTNRGPFSRRPVTSDVLESLAADAPAGAELAWVTDPGRISALGDLYVAATRSITEDEQMSTEAFSWFRNDLADVERHRDGLTLNCQGLDGFTLAMAKILPAQSRRSGDAFWLRTTRDTHTATASAYGIVRVSDVEDAHDRLAGGRLLEHVHLAATAAGLAVQHMNQVGERITREAALRATDRFGAGWADATGIAPGQSLLGFRIGYPGRVAGPSPRRPVSDVLVTR